MQTSLGVDHMLVISGGVPAVSVWAGHGDSGSVVMNESDEVIGLNFTIAGEDIGADLGSLGTAMPIHNVQEALGVDVAVAL
jgi:hypothetical protein